MRDWPWFWIILWSAAVGLWVPLPLDGWINGFLFWGAFLGAIACSVHARRAPR